MKKTNEPSEDIKEETILLKPKYQAILSIIAHFQHNKKNIQRAHLIRVLVKNEDSNQGQIDLLTDKKKEMKKSREHWYTQRTKTIEQHANDTDSIGKDTIDRLQTLGDAAPKVMFNSIANLDKTVAHLRKLGLVTNQYVRGYPRIILTDKGRTFFYSFVYSSFVFKTITELINRLH